MKSKKAQLELLAILNPYVLLGIGIFIILLLLGIIVFTKTWIGILLIVAAVMLIFRGIDIKISGVLLLIGALFIIQPAFLFDNFSILGSNYYPTIDADLEKIILQSNEDSVNLLVDWSTYRFSGGDYFAHQVVWIYKNGEFYETVVFREEQGAKQHIIPINGFNPGWNDVTVKFGMQDFFEEGDCRYSYSKTCGSYIYRGSFMCKDQQEMFAAIGCSVWSEVAQGQANYGAGSALGIQRDTSSEIGGLLIKQKTVQLYKEVGAEIPPIEETPKCGFFCQVWNWLTGN